MYLSLLCNSSSSPPPKMFYPKDYSYLGGGETQRMESGVFWPCLFNHYSPIQNLARNSREGYSVFYSKTRHMIFFKRPWQNTQQLHRSKCKLYILPGEGSKRHWYTKMLSKQETLKDSSRANDHIFLVRIKRKILATSEHLRSPGHFSQDKIFKLCVLKIFQLR